MGKQAITRRGTLAGIGAVGAGAVLGAAGVEASERAAGGRNARVGRADARRAIFERVAATPLIDTHEHLLEERERLVGTEHPRIGSDDWSLLLSHYLDSDMVVAGMSGADYERFFSPEVDPADKWKLLAPWWPAVRNTGYGTAVTLAMRELYGVQALSAETVRQVQQGYEKTRRKGFYREILCERGKIESCQVNNITGSPFGLSDMPTLLMQDLSIVGMFSGPGFGTFGEPAGIEVRGLEDWHRVIDWWFDKYGKYAVAVKSQNAYGRDIDYARTPKEQAEGAFAARLRNESPAAEQRKAMEDHLFWYAVDKATACNLPVKLHTGYYAGQGSMPLDRLIRNPGSATNLCRDGREARFVFMHICYPYYEDLIAAAKQWPNAYVDMCWAWIINPVAAKDFLKKFLVTAPANKVLTFGGDYIPVEPVLGHAMVARRGIGLALAELVEEGWMTLDDAMEKAEMVMCGNARRLFDLEAKTKVLDDVKWG